jgi:hypothetical protein
MRQLRRSAVVAITLVLIGASTAQAEPTLYTAAQFRGTRGVTCSVVNTGTRNVTVTTQLVGFFGNVVDDNVDQVIAPGLVGGRSISVGGGGLESILFCRFIVTEGSKANLRASYCVSDAAGICQASGDAR